MVAGLPLDWAFTRDSLDAPALIVRVKRCTLMAAKHALGRRLTVTTRGWTATNMKAQKKLFTVCAIGPIRLLALVSYISLTNQILIFGILDLNFQSEFH